MYHFFVEPGQVHDNYVEILGGDVNHMKNVLRMKPGEEITISDGFGHEYSCNVSELTEDSVRAEILERREVSVELPSRLVLFQCLPKGDQDGVDRPESGRTWSICGSSSCFQTLCGEAGCKEGG